MEAEKEILRPSIQRNSYFAHHENLLLCLLGSSELEDREFAVHVIMKISRKEREQQKGEERGEKPKKKAWKTKPTKKIREFKMPAIVW